MRRRRPAAGGHADPFTGRPVKGTEFVLRSIVADGVDHVFMIPGGLIDPFYPALQAVPELRPIVTAQEGGAAFAADGYGRASGHFGACLVIGGPGLTNTVTAPEKCSVPDVRGLTTSIAGRLLRAAGCALGKVSKKATKKKSEVGRVTAQKTKAGTKLAKGTKVAVTVGTAAKAARRAR